MWGVPLSLPFLLLVVALGAPRTAHAQFTSQNYPDPRTEPLRCKLLLPGQVCDPSDILNDEERRKLNEKVQQLGQVTAQIHNSSPQCVGRPTQNLQIVIALLEKIGASPLEPVDIEKFTNNLRLKYLNFQDLTCDTLVLIVNSRRDRQVFTVAGRDARLSKEALQNAFHRNIGHFRQNRYAMGLEGMVEYIVSAYSSMHIVQIPTPDAMTPTSSGIESVSSGANSFVAHGVRQSPDSKTTTPAAAAMTTKKLDLSGVPEEDRLWVELMLKAMGRCGYDQSKLAENVRAVVEEAMSVSLKLLSDARYSKIEETSQDLQSGINGREKAWAEAKDSFLDALYTQYRDAFPRRVGTCPQLEPEAPRSADGLFGPFGR